MGVVRPVSAADESGRATLSLTADGTIRTVRARTAGHAAGTRRGRALAAPVGRRQQASERRAFFFFAAAVVPPLRPPSCCVLAAGSSAAAN